MKTGTMVDKERTLIKSDWDKLVNFSPEGDNFGDWTKINAWLMYMTQAYRTFLGVPIYVICGFQDGGHTTGSQHYIGRALDIHFKGRIPLMAAYLAAERFGFTGIGIYPHWKPYPGMHIDYRILEEFEP